MFDLILVGGTVIDGTRGARPVRTDVGVNGGRITAVCDLGAAEAVECIDATGCLVTPGFIDAHSHSDTYLLLEPDAPSKVAQGITTEVVGQCGGSGVPALSRELAVRMATKRAGQSRGSGAQIIGTACPMCKRQLTRGIAKSQENKDLTKVMDIAELVLMALE